MGINRVHSSDTQLFVDGQRIPAVQSLTFTSEKNQNRLARLGVAHLTETILGPNQATTIDYSILLTTGATGIDPFYSYQQMQSGFLSTGSFKFEKKDVAGVSTVSGATLTSYSVAGAVGSLAKGDSSYRGDGEIFTSAGALTTESTDEFGGFFAPQDITVSTEVGAAGKEGVSSDELHIQDFSISVSIDKEPITRLGTRVPITRYPSTENAGSLQFNMVKNKVTGLDISALVCETGVIKIDLKDDDGNSVMDFVTSGCCLESVDESTALDDNTMISFSYYFPIIQ
jgi:hypothetical protein